MKYLVIECEELDDQYECDAKRTPICVTDNYEKYNKMGYEIYQINSNGSLKKIRDYEDAVEEGMCVSYWTYDSETPYKVIKLPYKDRYDITEEDIKKLKKEYNLKESIKEINDRISDSGHYTEYNDDTRTYFSICEYADDLYYT